MMRTSRIVGALVVCGVLMAASLRAQSYDKLWKQVERAEAQGLPQTVVRLTEDVSRKAEREQNLGQWLKALRTRNHYQEQLTPDSFYLHVRNLEERVVRTPDEVEQALLHSLLGEVYTDYVQENLYTLRRRTDLDTDTAPADLRAWTLPQFMQCIIAHWQASLQPAERLLDTRGTDYRPFVEAGDDSRYYAHSLYHLLSRRALEAYRDLQKSLDAHYLPDSLIANGYADALRFYTDRGLTDAVVLTALQRWEWQDGEQSEPLDSLLRLYGRREVCAELYLKKAELLHRAALRDSALQVCSEGIRRYLRYSRIDALKNQRAQWLKPTLSVNLPEYAYPGDTLRLKTSYTNLTGFTLQLYTTDYARYPYLPDGVTAEVVKQHARRLSSVHHTLTASTRRTDSLFRLPLPAAPGVYLLRVQPDGKDAQPSTQLLAVSRLKVLTLDLPDNQTEVVTLDARSGHPVADATVSFYASAQGEPTEPLAEVTTDAYGRTQLTWQEKIRAYTAAKGDDAAMPRQDIYRSNRFRPVAEQPQERLTLLTDRSLYRPGQTIYLKGVAYSQLADSAWIQEGKEYEVCLLDANRKEVSRRKVRTNDFGSFSTEFTLPAVCQNGNWWLEVPRTASVNVKVEEYKRPSFEIACEPLTSAYRVGDTVVWRGRVTSYAGVPVEEVPLSYTFTRYSFYPRRGKAEATLCADTVRLQPDGSFTLPLCLQPDGEGRSASYRLNITVTDGAGETQSDFYAWWAEHDRSLNVDNPLAATLCKESAFRYAFVVQNMSGETLPVEGIYRIYPYTASRPTEGEAPLLEGRFTSGVEQTFAEWNRLPSGHYRLMLSVRDSRGREDILPAGDFVLFSEADTRPPLFSPLFLYERQTEFDASQPARLYFGTSCPDAYVLMDIFTPTRRLESRTLSLSDSIACLDFPYRAEYGEGVAVLFTLVKLGKTHSRRVELRKCRPNRTLDLRWEVFRNRLTPGAEEKWKLVLKAPDGLLASAEVLALMYDASLDALWKRPQSLRLSYTYRLPSFSRISSRGSGRSFTLSFSDKTREVPAWSFDRFFMPTGAFTEGGVMPLYIKGMKTTRAVGSAKAAEVRYVASQTDDNSMLAEEFVTEESATEPLRTNFSETAFFYPHLRTNEQGEVVVAFTLPQSLTRWNFRSYAHTRDMQTGELGATVTAAKEFMLSPHLPRFLRAGDRVTLSATVSLLSDSAVKGTATLTLFDPQTEKAVLRRKASFALTAARNSTVVTFDFTVPEAYDLLGIRLVADGGAFSDGEQHLMPVLSDREELTETLPILIRGGERRVYALDSLFNRNSPTATHRRLTVEMSGNPAWYAVQALPSLGLPEDENALSWAAAYYAGTLAHYLYRSVPPIQSVLQPKEQRSESEADFLSEQEVRTQALLSRLKEWQGDNGAWGWYRGMDGNRYITAYIVKLLLRLPLLTGEALPEEALRLKNRAWNYLHEEARKEYRSLLKGDEKALVSATLSGAALDYLYLLALEGGAVPAENRKAYDCFLSMLTRDLATASVLRKAQTYVVLRKAGRTDEAAAVLASLKELLTTSLTEGAHFAFHDSPYTWGMQPVPAHVAAMEALRLAGGEDALLEEMKLWLLRQKQVTAWNTPVATADALYALLAGDTDLLSRRGDVRLTLGREVIETQMSDTSDELRKAAGYVRRDFAEGSAALKAKRLTVQKRDEGVAWGAVYAQYRSPQAEVRQHGGELNVERALFVERIDGEGRRSLRPITETPLRVGDRLVSRLTICLDRAMDFVQLKEHRAACLEPVGSLSGYRWNDGLGYYREVKDTAVNYYFDHLGRGVYVLEQAYRVTRSGSYGMGTTTLQSTYAPELASHSDGAMLEVE